MWKHKNFINLQLCAGETWVLNDSLTDTTGETGFLVKVNFTSNSAAFTKITLRTRVGREGVQIDYDTTTVYDSLRGSGWLDQAYRTITFDEPVTDTTLLTWLQANGTKQSTPQPTLTFKHFFDAGTIGSGTVKFRHYSQQEPTPSGYADCLTFTGETSEFTLAVGSNGAKEWDGIVEYSTDHNTWTTWNGTAISSVDKKLYLRGSGNTKFYTSKGARLSLSARAACSGNIQTLLEYSNPPTTIPASYCYRNMFYNCTNLATAPTLPATTLADFCYSDMFNGCTSLIQAPTLPATTLADSCYQFMFMGCTNLTAVPELPATTLAGWCYSHMFQSCTSLIQAPTLPATTLASRCYQFMFMGCTNLKISSTQSSEYPATWRIPSSGTISSTSTNWNYNMLNGTGGTFTGNPSANTTYYGAW